MIGDLLASLCDPRNAHIVGALDKLLTGPRAPGRYVFVKEGGPDPRGSLGDAVGKKAKMVAAIIQRDGDGCWLCGDPLGNDMSFEHLTPQSAGGTDELDNLALAHVACNRQLGNLPRPLKEALRERVRAERQ